MSSPSLWNDMIIVCVIAVFAIGEADAIPVTFQVDLTIQEAIGRFDPDTSSVEVRGSFNAWEGGDEMSRLAPDQAVYVHEIDVPDGPGATVPYKFVIIDADGTIVWESDVGEGQSNRTFMVVDDAAQELPVVFFDNLAVDPGGGVAVTFQVDMAARIQDQTFDPASDYVSVRGPFNNWEAGDRLSPVEDGSTVYAGTVEVKFILPGTAVPYKYMINDAEWETGENRLFELGDSAHTLAARFFDDIEPVNIGPLGSIAISTEFNGAYTLRWENPNAILEGTTDLAAEVWDEVFVPDGATEILLSTDLARSLFFRVVLR